MLSTAPPTPGPAPGCCEVPRPSLPRAPNKVACCRDRARMWWANQLPLPGTREPTGGWLWSAAKSHHGRRLPGASAHAHGQWLLHVALWPGRPREKDRPGNCVGPLRPPPYPPRRGRPPAAAAVTARPSNRTPPPSLEMPARHTPLRCGRTQLHARGAVSERAPALRPGSCGSVWATPPVHRERLSVSRWASNIMPGSEERAEAPQVGRRCLDGVGCGRRGGAGA